MTGFVLRKNHPLKKLVPVRYLGDGIAGEGIIKDLSLSGSYITGNVLVSVGGARKSSKTGRCTASHKGTPSQPPMHDEFVGVIRPINRTTYTRVQRSASVRLPSSSNSSRSASDLAFRVEGCRPYFLSIL
jgi:hypothetical protein